MTDVTNALYVYKGNGESTQQRSRKKTRSRGTEAGSAALPWTKRLPELWLMWGQSRDGLGGTTALAGFEAPPSSWVLPNFVQVLLSFWKHL